MHSRYFLTLLVIMAFSTGMTEHGGAFDRPGFLSGSLNSLRALPLLAQDSIYRDNSGEEESKSGGKKEGKKGEKSAKTGNVRDVKPRPNVKDREKVKDRVPVKRP